MGVSGESPPLVPRSTTAHGCAGEPPSSQVSTVALTDDRLVINSHTVAGPEVGARDRRGDSTVPETVGAVRDHLSRIQDLVMASWSSLPIIFRGQGTRPVGMISVSPPPTRVGLAFEAAGTLLLVSAILIEIMDGPLLPELALSLAGAASYLVATPLNRSGNRVLLVVATALASLVAVACLVRIEQQPLLNGLHVIPLLLAAYAASTRRSTIQRQRLLQRERSQARHDGEEHERRRWARELHDDTLQELGAVQVTLSAATAEGRPETMRSAIEQARDLVGNQITSLRHLIVDLRPAALDELGLCPALDALCRRTEETFTVPVRLQMSHLEGCANDLLTPETQAHAYRIVQEALTNAVKHSGPTRITVGVQINDQTVMLTVADDGCGMPRSMAAGRRSDHPALNCPSVALQGVGLSAMHERADLIGAQIEIQSTPAQGTTVTLQIPTPQRVDSRSKA